MFYATTYEPIALGSRDLDFMTSGVVKTRPSLGPTHTGGNLHSELDD